VKVQSQAKTQQNFQTSANPFSSSHTDYFVIQEKLKSSVWYHKTEALQILKETILGLSEEEKESEDLV